MSLMINLVDIPSVGLSIGCTVEPSEIDLSAEDGKLNGPLSCMGHIFPTDDQMATFQGTVTGKVIRECVRCLMNFEESFSLSWDAQFRQSNQSVVLPLPLKKVKKGRRRHDSAIDDEQENEIDMYPIIDNQIDLLPALREHLILATPLQPLCQERCAGLCQVCGANLNEGVCGCCSPVTDSSVFVSHIHLMLSQKTAKHSSRSL